MAFRIIVKGHAVPKRRPRIVTKGKQTWAYTPQATKVWEEHIAWAWRARYGRHALLSGDLEMGLLVVTTKRHRADIDNLMKAVKDGLEGVAYVNDRQVRSEHTQAIVWPGASDDYVIVDLRELDDIDNPARYIRDWGLEDGSNYTD